MGNDKIQLFEDKRIRTAWDAEKEEWYIVRSDFLCFAWKVTSHSFRRSSSQNRNR